MKTKKVYYIGKLSNGDIHLLGEGNQPVTFTSLASAKGVLEYLKTLNPGEFDEFSVYSGKVVTQ